MDSSRLTKWFMVEALYDLRIREVGSEYDFHLWHAECFGEGWTARQTEMPSWLPRFGEEEGYAPA